MRYFIFRVSLVFLAVGLLVGMLRYLSPFYYGNPIYLHKFPYLHAPEKEINTIFFGSSRIFRQIDPAVFDQSFCGEMNSFNMGAGGTFGLEINYVVEHFLKDKNKIPKNLRWLVIELQTPVSITDENLHSPKSKYFVDHKRYRIGSDFYKSTYAPDEAIKAVDNLRSSFIENILSIGLLRMQLLSLIPQNANQSFLGKNFDGFVPLNRDITTDMERRQDFIKNVESYVNDFQMLYAIDGRQNVASYSNVSEAYVRALKELITISKERGIHVCFVVLPTGFKIDQANTLAIYEELPATNRIDVGSFQKFPELYDPELYFDRGHLNKRGADILSRMLAEEICNLSKSFESKNQ